ncbi:hypothetical protein [Streptomyces zingiberis]|uniref:Uncharacterized protein n=1 Tax=Streptomyces zingiberis TaxID=2053010 RepID=A0ABX1BVP5_9ACTN|nr:hypothetical protein [Streptomyces zingiberis]NJP99949.1 hypothetical protein [Streptomyces zingiberis]
MDAETSGNGDGDGGGPSSGADGRNGDGGSGDAGGASDMARDGGLLLGGFAVAALAAVWLGARRAFRRDRGGGQGG